MYSFICPELSYEFFQVGNVISLDISWSESNT
jgi:hypothetical protein